MAVMARDMWTDERLDDLAAQVDKRFDRVDSDIRQLRADMDKGFDRVDSDMREVKADIKDLRSEMNSRFDSMQRMMFIGFVTLFASIVASVIGGLFAI